MSQHYSDPTREEETYALPDVEVFYADGPTTRDWQHCGGADDDEQPGWYFWYCLPGCLPDSEPFGPYATEQEAIDAMREMCED